MPDSTGCVHMDVSQLQRRLAAGAVPQPLGRQHLQQPLHRPRPHLVGADADRAAQQQFLDPVHAAGQRPSRAGVQRHQRRRRDRTPRVALRRYRGRRRDAQGAGAHDPASAARFWGVPRAPMTLAISEDGGRTWPHRRNLEVGDGYCMTNNSREQLNREYSYPSIKQGPDGALHIAFTYFRQAIKYVRVARGLGRADEPGTPSSPAPVPGSAPPSRNACWPDGWAVTGDQPHATRRPASRMSRSTWRVPTRLRCGRRWPDVPRYRARARGRRACASAPWARSIAADGAAMWRLHVEAACLLADAVVPRLPEGGRIVLLGSRTRAGFAGQRASTRPARRRMVGLARSWADGTRAARHHRQRGRARRHRYADAAGPRARQRAAEAAADRPLHPARGSRGADRLPALPRWPAPSPVSRSSSAAAPRCNSPFRHATCFGNRI